LEELVPGEKLHFGHQAGNRYRSYNGWLRERFGERVHKVVVDAGFTCPNRDGTLATGGCTYCNNTSFRPPHAIKTDPIAEQVRVGISYLRTRVEANKFIVYFQPFSNTYADTEYLRQLYTDALDHPDVVGLAIGTRPDCIDEENIDMIDAIARDTMVSLEFGLESIYDETLKRVNRAHDYGAFLRAMDLCRGKSFHIGAHVIVGFPWETREQWLAMADEISRVGVNMLKIHHLHLVRGTALATEHLQNPFRLLTFDEYADVVCDFVERLDPAIVIERFFGEAPGGMLVAPDWDMDRNQMIAGIRRRMEERDVRQGAVYQGASPTVSRRSTNRGSGRYCSKSGSTLM
jgi:radical SAM protein (TIGR01212 family)